MSKYPWDESATMQGLWDIHCIGAGAALKYGDYVLAIADTYNGFEAAVYKFTHEEKDDTVFWECGMKLITVATNPFPDGGHAVEWCLKQLG
ncbi:MAG TPA: hypothetical protein P5092_14485 [Ruminococcus sp.]|nr:hypothetical protein [Ruminococcus sp.]